MPDARAINSGGRRRATGSAEVPATLDWDLWLGPAQQRPYSPAYLPGSWRGWVPFGDGTVGDWTCHVVDPVFWALDLGLPTTIQAKPSDYDPKTQTDVFPVGEIITYEFPAKGGAPRPGHAALVQRHGAHPASQGAG